jgi:NAD(P)-dependent dehydrogenase (short-subunit alcohol dehydrogenase family)
LRPLRTYSCGIAPPAAASTATGLFLYDLTDESSIINACSILGTPPDLVLVASGLLHDQSGAVMPEKTLRAIQPEAMARMFAVNTIGPVLIAKHWLPRLPKDRRAVFAVLSARGFNWRQPAGGWHGYRASKAALNMLIANFAIEMRRTHPLAVIVALHPGTVATGLSRPFQSGVAPGQLFSPETAAAHLLDVIDRLTPKDSGGFLPGTAHAYDGERASTPDQPACWAYGAGASAGPARKASA